MGVGPTETQDVGEETFGEAVPAHDARDFEFAGKYGIDIEVVIAPADWDGQPLAAAYTVWPLLIVVGYLVAMKRMGAFENL